MRSTLAAAALGALALAGCGGTEEQSAPPDTTAAAPATTEAADGLTACAGDGWSFRYPPSWHVNDGSVLPPCSRLHSEPFEVQPNTDARVAAISISIEPVALETIATLSGARDVRRALTAVDGLRAERLRYRSNGMGLWPVGTPRALYAVELPPEDGEARTLVLDTVGVGGFDFEASRRVLEQVARTLDVSGAGDGAVVARYDQPRFAVRAATVDGRPCLGVVADVETICTEPPAADQVHTIQLDPGEPVLGGITGTGVERITAVRRGGDPLSFLPVRVPGTDLGAFVFPFPLGEIERLRLYDAVGAELRTIVPGPA